MDYRENICSLKWAIMKGYVKFSQFGRQLDIKVQIHAINSYIWGSKWIMGSSTPKCMTFFYLLWMFLLMYSLRYKPFTRKSDQDAYFTHYYVPLPIEICWLVVEGEAIR